MTIAATIPVLKPLVDLVFGRGALGESSYINKGNCNEHDNMDSLSNGHGISDIEFGSRKAATTTNIIKSIVGDDNESQTSLVQEHGQSRQAPSAHRNNQSGSLHER